MLAVDSSDWNKVQPGQLEVVSLSECKLTFLTIFYRITLHEKPCVCLHMRPIVQVLDVSFSSVDPLAHVMQAYREQLLEKALYSLVTPGYQNNNIVGPNKGYDGYVHCRLHVISDIFVAGPF